MPTSSGSGMGPDRAQTGGTRDRRTAARKARSSGPGGDPGQPEGDCAGTAHHADAALDQADRSFPRAARCCAGRKPACRPMRAGPVGLRWRGADKTVIGGTAGQHGMTGFPPLSRLQVFSVQKAPGLRGRAARLPARLDDGLRRAAGKEGRSGQPSLDLQGVRCRRKNMWADHRAIEPADAPAKGGPEEAKAKLRRTFAVSDFRRARARPQARGSAPA